ncbi:MAG: C45 family autoproteolytic acyltransferase/hydrolase [Propionibacteriaceae bacterium]
MKIRTIRLQPTDPAARGRAYGEAARAEIQLAITLYRAHFVELGLDEATLVDAGTTAVDALRSWRRAAAAELVAVAGAAQVLVADLGVLTARTEVLALTSTTPDECSAVAAAPAHGPAWSLQTWDWIPRLAPTGLLVEFPGVDRTVRTFTEPGMPAKIGVNTDGLGLQFNILHHTADGNGVGVGVHSIARAVLEEAGTLAEAHQIAASAPVTASSVFTIVSVAGDQEAEVGCLEITPAGVELLPGTDGFIAHANHLIAEPLLDGERSPSTTTTARLEHLRRQRPALTTAATFVDRAAAACGGLGQDAPICITADPSAPPAEQSATLLTIGTDPVTATLDWSVGVPASATADTVGHFSTTQP